MLPVPPEGGGIRAVRVLFFPEVPTHVYRPAFPREARLPGVLLIQGWDLDKHSLAEFKIRLAQAGFVVLFPDNRFSGERRRAADGQAEQANLFPVAGLFGLTFMG